MNQFEKTRRPVKKSTVLLVSVVLALLTLYSLYIIVVNQRFASQKFTYANNDKTQYRKLKFEPHQVVVINGLRDGLILMSDSISLEVFNDDAAALRSEAGGDTLKFIFSEAAVNRAFLYLPNGIRLVVDSSSLEMRGSLDYRALPEYDLKLHSSSLLASGHNTHAFVGKLAVAASGDSRLKIARYFHVNELNLHNVYDATFAQGWQIGNLTTSFEDGTKVAMDKYRDSVVIRPIRF